jgi:hypothetical protein
MTSQINLDLERPSISRMSTIYLELTLVQL